MCVTIKQSKTDPFQQGINLFLGVTEHAVFPVNGPLFISEKGIPLTQQYFSKALSTILKHIGLDDQQYSTHSFHIGAATSAKASRSAKYSHKNVKMLTKYIRAAGNIVYPADFYIMTPGTAVIYSHTG